MAESLRRLKRLRLDKCALIQSLEMRNINFNFTRGFGRDGRRRRSYRLQNGRGGAIFIHAILCHEVVETICRQSESPNLDHTTIVLAESNEELRVQRQPTLKIEGAMMLKVDKIIIRFFSSPHPSQQLRSYIKHEKQT